MLGLNHLLKTIIGVAVVNGLVSGPNIVPVAISTGIAVAGMIAGEAVLPDLVQE